MRTKSRSSSTSSKYSHLLYLNNQERDFYLKSLSSLHLPASRPESTSFFSMSSSRNSSVRSSRSSFSESLSTEPLSVSSRKISTPKYADDRYPLITSINPAAVVNVPANVPKTHAAFRCARQMAGIHNTMIRALNSSYNHALGIEAGTQRCRDFLEFNRILCTTTDRHHEVEDEFLFPEWERLVGRLDAIGENTKGHGMFTQGFRTFQRYVFDSDTVADFDGRTHRKLIEDFAPELIQHLHDEISTIVGLYTVESKALHKVWMQAHKMITQNDDLYTACPFFLGCQDKTFRIDGEITDFPSVPRVAEVLVRYWHAKRHAGVWEFCPSDLHGQRRLLKT